MKGAPNETRTQGNDNVNYGYLHVYLHFFHVLNVVWNRGRLIIFLTGIGNHFLQSDKVNTLLAVQEFFKCFNSTLLCSGLSILRLKHFLLIDLNWQNYRNYPFKKTRIKLFFFTSPESITTLYQPRMDNLDVCTCRYQRILRPQFHS